MTVLDCVLLAGIAAALVFAVRSVFRDLRRGKCCGCCGNCKACHGDVQKKTKI